MIAIKGMTMPKSCSECPMFHDGWADDFCGITELPLVYPEYLEVRHKTCPLIELDRRLENEINVYQYECKLEKKKEKQENS